MAVMGSIGVGSAIVFNLLYVLCLKRHVRPGRLCTAVDLDIYDFAVYYDTIEATPKLFKLTARRAFCDKKGRLLLHKICTDVSDPDTRESER